MNCYSQVIEMNSYINKMICYFPSTIYPDTQPKYTIIINRKTILKLMYKLMKSLRILLRVYIPNFIIKSLIVNMSVLNVIQKLYIPMFKRNVLSIQPRQKYRLFTIDDELDAYYTITLVNELYNNGINMLMKYKL